jgi:hypothetical protein
VLALDLLAAPVTKQHLPHQPSNQDKLFRRRKRIKVAPASMPEREVRKVAAESLRSLNHGFVSLGSATRFRDYVEVVYQETVLPVKAKSTQHRYRSVIRKYLLPAFGEVCLRDITPQTAQQYFSGMVDSPLSQESKDKIRDVLSAILGSAVKYGYLVKNPVEGVILPRSKMKRHKPVLRPPEFAILLEAMEEPYASMVYVAMYTGLRVSPTNVTLMRRRG